MKAAFYTLGCKVNQYETEYMSELLKNAGFEIVSYEDDADYYIVNSCTVTSTADQKTRQNVRKLKRKHPDSVVILTGCMPQAFPESAEALSSADIILSNKNDSDILSLINEYNATKNRVVRIEKHSDNEPFEKCSVRHFKDRIRAFIKIEDGCDRFCSYCIIPKARGRVRSKSPENLRSEVETLVKNGIKEVVLVGINLSAYGKGESYNLADAVSVCNDIDGLLRIRLGSLEPENFTDNIIEGLSKCEKFCPQFHLSLQSGCDKTLKSMNRHYTSEEYADICKKLRSNFESCAITTDVIVGFNDESEEDFKKSLDFVKSMHFEKVHTFPYSERKGTAASKRGDNVSKQKKENRASVMILETEKIREGILRKMIGKNVEVLFENQLKGNIYQGYTRDYFAVRVKSENNLVGVLKSVKIVDVKDDYCIAE